MMFRTIAFLAALGAASAGKAVELPSGKVPASSRLGQRILSKARQLDGDEATWVANMNLMFVKCAVTEEYIGDQFGGEQNNDANQWGGGMYKQRLAHFRLCPAAETCSSSCSGGADYVIDLGMFLEAYVQSKLDAQEYNCEMVRENCYNDDEYYCYQEAGLDYCMDNENQNGQEEFQLEDAAECRELDVDQDAVQYWLYNEGGVQQQYYNGEAQEAKLTVGPVCSDNGKSVHLAVFQDEWCQTPAPSGAYENFFYGQSLPYSQESLIASDCISCKEPQDANDQNNGDQQDEDEVLEICERIYEDAGKCESDMDTYPNGPYYKNEYGCNIIKSLHAPGSSGSSGTAGKVFAVIFALSTVAIGGAAYYFYTKSKRQNVALAGDAALA